MIAAIIAAAGSGERIGAGIPKALIQLGDRTLIEHAISSLSSVADQIIVTAPNLSPLPAAAMMAAIMS